MSYRVALGCSLCNTINVKNMHPHQDLGGKEASLLPYRKVGGEERRLLNCNLWITKMYINLKYC